MKYSHSPLILCAFFSLFAISQEKKAGPIIENYGEVFAVEKPDFKTDVTQEFKVVFDVSVGPDSHEEINKRIETAARFLNMHAQNGVPVSQLKAALIIHGSATTNIMNNEAHEKRFGVPNPNAEMLQNLVDNGVEIILCGQSSNARNVPKEDLIPGEKIALSAMTALIQLQNDGYRPMKL
ncbi:DsrE family protein [Muricauda sp. CAU 1633]|uniref:DsrE family protein n=1 Tax=Allomuricauda sp. CAU 1633 TaxID=2816036 RepID=UPI001A90512E|nr:DsrE family protein [Muricauda sp. CAU 1633]MBO0323106.1 DsrE family protein [Muricauda sp. CAU 1633]